MHTKQEFIQDLYQKAIIFAAARHHEKGQKVPGTNLPYVVHLSNVAMEIMMASSHTKDFDLGFAIQLALLHDTLEDTSTTFDDLETNFGLEIALAVSALTKDESLPKGKRMQDCLYRIKKMQKEVWAVKLADRITNLDPPPDFWDKSKRIKYLEEARKILKDLKGGNEYSERRLEGKIGEYLKLI
jgi:guanosine-3',5'-bis(diphosphate) 3'-pyrophosphohydrolase